MNPDGSPSRIDKVIIWGVIIISTVVIAGIVIGATQIKERAATVLNPFLTLFAALFFVSFGARIELSDIGTVAAPAILLVVLGISTKVSGGFLAALASRLPLQQAVTVGMSLVPKGEFSILIAALASAAATADSGIEPLTAIYVLALSVIGPVLMRESDRVWQAFQR